MNIGEIEELTGLERANIRFYEQKGLLSPARSENGYRNYSDDDISVLKKIKLLRTIGLSIEEIRHVSERATDLSSLLEQRIHEFAEQRTRTEHLTALCISMQCDCVSYDTLDADKYLNALADDSSNTVQDDIIPACIHPWRRYFARCFDLMLYSVAVYVFAVYILRADPTFSSGLGSVIHTLFSHALMIFAEPLFLSLFASTPGKFIFGLTVTRIDGAKLSYSEALSRTWRVFTKGLGLDLPVYAIIRLYKSYSECSNANLLPWEEESVCTIRDKRFYRIIIYMSSLALVLVTIFFAVAGAYMPPHRGELTAADFADNFNAVSERMGFNNNLTLSEDLSWQEKDSSDGGDYFHVFASELSRPEITTEPKNGKIFSLAFTASARSEDWLSDPQNIILPAFISFAGADKSVSCLELFYGDSIKKITDSGFDGIRIQIGNTVFESEYEYSGYDNAGGVLIPIEGMDSVCAMRVTIENTSK